ncbi:MAG: 50S ribosomal protein L9 [Alphaproteobacteria bacterium]|nr:50S ribosomal protein L9 [Alphaproteobacteria bacterium]
MSATEVILLERVESLGQMGDVVKVKPGFARNFLLPQKKAMRATKDNLAYFEKQRAQLEAMNLERKSEAEKVAVKMDGLSVVIIRQAGETGQLYGSVSNRDIAEAITAAGYTVDRRQVLLTQPIKALGIHAMRVALHPEVSIGVKVNVAQSAEEAKMQAEGKPAAAPAPEAAPPAEEAAPAAEATPAEAAAESDKAEGDKPKGEKRKKKKTAEA